MYRWNLRSSRCLERFHDEGSTGITSISAGTAGSQDGYLSVGSRSGYVNIYTISGSIYGASKNRSTSFLEDSGNDLGNEWGRDTEENLHFATELYGHSPMLVDRSSMIGEFSERKEPLKVLLFVFV